MKRARPSCRSVVTIRDGGWGIPVGECRRADRCHRGGATDIPASHRDVPREWNPIYKLIDDVRRDGVEEVRGGTWCEVVLPDDATILCRLIVEHCLFGVAPDPIAVEVAKAAPVAA